MTVIAPAVTESDLKKINLAIQQLAAGRSNANGTVTLTQNSATTVVTTRPGTVMPASTTPSGGTIPASHITLTPLTANAATEFGAGTWYISSVGVDTFTITHVNSATASRTFSYAVSG